MNIKYNYKEMENIELYITKSEDDDTITLKIAFIDNHVKDERIPF